MKIVKEFKEFEKQAQSISIYQKKIHQIEEEVCFNLSFEKCYILETKIRI